MNIFTQIPFTCIATFSLTCLGSNNLPWAFADSFPRYLSHFAGSPKWSIITLCLPTSLLYIAWTISVYISISKSPLSCCLSCITCFLFLGFDICTCLLPLWIHTHILLAIYTSIVDQGYPGRDREERTLLYLSLIQPNKSFSQFCNTQFSVRI